LFFALSLTTAALLSSVVTVHAQTAQSLNGTQLSATPVLALVNGRDIPMAAFELSLKDQLRSVAQDSQALREKVRRDLVFQAVLAQLAEKARLDQTPFVAQHLVAARHAVMAQAWQQQWEDANLPTDAELAADYEALKARTGNKEYQMRQVVVQDETAAKLLLNQLDAG
jgi:peptidyl-prolyl cis-trans isomerase C